jgi:hypothetical protein
LEFAKTGRPVTILTASSCSLSNLLAFTDPQLSQTSEAYSIQSIINHDLKELDEWSKRWLMTFNPDTTEIMLFTNLEHPEIKFTFEDNIISTSNIGLM